MARDSRRCAVAGCRAWARHGDTLCRSHAGAAGSRDLSAGANAAGREGQLALPGCGPASRASSRHHSGDGNLTGLYAHTFTPEERAEIARQLASPQRTLEAEVAVMRVMIRRVMERIGEDDPLRALPLIRQGVDAICRALRTERVLSGEGADSLAGAFAVAVREIAEEMKN